MPAFRESATRSSRDRRVKIWIDAQLSPGLARWIRETFGIEAQAVRDLGLRGAKDPVIFKAAREARVVVMSKDDLLNTVMLYWITQSFGTSARYYYEAMHNLWRPSHKRVPVVEAPTGMAVFVNEVVLMPRKWAERYYNLQRWTVMPSGGHFGAMEEPERLVEDIRAFFRSLRG